MLLDHDPVAQVPTLHTLADLHDTTGVLVPQRDGGVGLVLVVEDVQVRPAHTAGRHLDHYPARLCPGLWHILQLDVALPGGGLHHSQQVRSSFAPPTGTGSSANAKPTPPPFMRFSTSALLAKLVSPGVVIARAP